MTEAKKSHLSREILRASEIFKKRLRISLCGEFKTKDAELDAAEQRIAELEADNKRLQKAMDSMVKHNKRIQTELQYSNVKRRWEVD